MPHVQPQEETMLETSVLAEKQAANNALEQQLKAQEFHLKAAKVDLLTRVLAVEALSGDEMLIKSLKETALSL